METQIKDFILVSRIGTNSKLLVRISNINTVEEQSFEVGNSKSIIWLKEKSGETSGYSIKESPEEIYKLIKEA